MKTIIAGTDFSKSSLNACMYAAMLAARFKCRLVVFNLFDAPVFHSNVGLYGFSYSSKRATTHLKTQRLIEKLKRTFPKLEIGHFITQGSFREELKEFNNTHYVLAAVMGLGTKNRISRFIYGSHGVDLAGKIDCPVIIVPENYKQHALSGVVLAVDNNEKLRKGSLSEFERFIAESRSKLKLVHVRTENEVFKPVLNSLMIAGKNKKIDLIAAKELQDGIKEFCDKQNADLIAIISKKHSAFYDFFNESNTKKVAFAAQIPVMAIHE